MSVRNLAAFVAYTAVALTIFVVCAENPSAPQRVSPSTDSVSSAQSLILQASDGEHLVRRSRGQTPAAGADYIPEFILKIDKQNGQAEDFVALTEDLKPVESVPGPEYGWRLVGGRRSPYSIRFVKQQWLGKSLLRKYHQAV